MSYINDVFNVDNIPTTDNIGKMREKIYSYDRSLIMSESNMIELDNIAEQKNGKFRTEYKGTVYDCFYTADDSSDVLYIVLNGSRNPGERLPIHKRWSYYKWFGGTVLNIADPMYTKFDSLLLGWYYGSKDECYAYHIAEMAQICADKLGKSKIIFFGSSGGGYASLLAACKVPGSMAVVINPQIKPALWHYNAGSFEKITGLSLREKDPLFRNDLPELIKQSSGSRFIFIENIRSVDDMVQVDELRKVIAFSNKYGIDKIADNIITWMYDANLYPQHNAQDFPSMFFAINYLARHFDDVDKLKELYLLFSEFWFEHFEAINKMALLSSSAKKKVTQIGECSGGNCNISVNCRMHMDITVPSSDNIWNNVIAFKDFKPETVYKINVCGSEVLSGSCEKYTILIKDVERGAVLFEKEILTGSSASYIFSTGSNTDDLYLRIYSGIPGKSNGISLIVRGLSVNVISVG